MLRTRSVFVLATLFAAALGCSKKVPECNTLIGQINGSASAMEAATREFSSSKQTKEASEKFAKANQAELDKLGKVELTLPELESFSKSYQGLLGSVATAAIAIGKSNGEREELGAAGAKNQAALVAAGTKLTRACEKARKECAALGDKLTGPPSFTGKADEDAKKLESYAKGLASVAANDADVKAATRDLEKAVLELAGVLKKSSSAQKQYEEALKALSDINANEPLLIRSINEFCHAG
jgi:DNA repair exonuclease SbcCD ATPase subunit